MTTTTDRASMLDKMPSEWDFAFWKEQYESARDIASALGILGAASSIKWEADKIIVYLMDIVDAKSRTNERARALGGKALQVLHRVLEAHRGFQSDSINFTALEVVEKALWLSRPASDFKSLVNHFAGLEEEQKYLRRYLRHICNTIWTGQMRCATYAHKLQVLDIFYASGRLMDYVPSPNTWLGAAGAWKRFEDVLSRLEELARMDLELGSTETIEEAAFFGYPAAYIVILTRNVLPAGFAFYARHRAEREKRQA